MESLPNASIATFQQQLLLFGCKRSGTWHEPLHSLCYACSSVWGSARAVGTMICSLKKGSTLFGWECR